MFDIRGGRRGKRKGRLRLISFHFGSQMLARASNREAFLIEQLFDVQNVFDVLAAIHALSGAAFHRLELGEFCLPESQNVRGQVAKAGNFADAEIKFVGNQHVAGLHLRRSFGAGAHQHFKNGVCRGRRLKLPHRVSITDGPQEQPKFSWRALL
jgi:hypothetical protein